jgi:hypothetical protein
MNVPRTKAELLRSLMTLHRKFSVDVATVSRDEYQKIVCLSDSPHSIDISVLAIHTDLVAWNVASLRAVAPTASSLNPIHLRMHEMTRKVRTSALLLRAEWIDLDFENLKQRLKSAESDVISFVNDQAPHDLYNDSIPLAQNPRRLIQFCTPASYEEARLNCVIGKQ